jgi:hypothetical protein
MVGAVMSWWAAQGWEKKPESVLEAKGKTVKGNT